MNVSSENVRLFGPLQLAKCSSVWASTSASALARHGLPTAPGCFNTPRRGIPAMPRPGSSAQARGPFYGVFGAYCFVSKEDVGLSFVEDRMLLKRRNPRVFVNQRDTHKPSKGKQPDHDFPKRIRFECKDLLLEA